MPEVQHNLPLREGCRYEYPADFDWRAVDRRNKELEELPYKERIAILHEEFPELAEGEAHNNEQREFSHGIEAEIREQRHRIADAFPKETRFRTEPFYSNAERAREEIKQSKATPEQWIAMVKKNGGLKAGEDAWLGLEEWLKTKKGAVTKEEILDYIDTNKIQIEEVEYKEYDYEYLDYDEDIETESEAYEERIAEEIDSMYGEVEGNDYEKRSRIEERLVDIYGESILEAVEVGYYGSYKITNPKHFVELMSGDKLTKAINSFRLGYTTIGLDNKREIALVVPTVKPYSQYDDIHFGDAGEGRAIAWVRFPTQKQCSHACCLVVRLQELYCEN